jgi:16S rRNA (guanine527-N7)-methyltransferase
VQGKPPPLRKITCTIDAHDPRLARYARLLLERTADVNLTGARTEAALNAHLDDALAIAPYIRAPYVDVGSGGGLPAIPLAIVTGAATTMIESTAKKAAFLREAVAELGIAATVVPRRAEIAAREPEHRERYASATARAVAGATTVLELTLPLLAEGGLAILQRGAPEAGEAEAVADAVLVLGGTLEATIDQGGGRRVLLVRKTAPTPQRFPRRVGQPAKRPLCV